MRLSILFSSTIFCLVFILTLHEWLPTSAARELNCEETREVDGVNYWFWDAFTTYDNVSKTDSYQTGKIKSYVVNICIKSSISEFANSESRLIGYTRAIRKLMIYLTSDRAFIQWDKNNRINLAKNRVFAITGIDFSSPEKVINWWNENQNYLMLSDDGQQLVVDEYAKRREQAIHTITHQENVRYFEDECLLSNKSASGHYWLEAILVNIGDSYDSDIDRNWFTKDGVDKCNSTPLSELDNPEHIMIVYKQLIHEVANGLEPYEQIERSILWNNNQRLLMYRRSIESLVNKDFKTHDDLKKWWNENQKYLVVSPDRLHLVVDQEAKQNGKVIQDFYFKKPVDLRADFYWYNEGMGYFHPNNYGFREVKDKGEYFIWIQPGMHESYEARVLKTSLTETNSKEDGYKRALENIITSLDDMLDLQYKEHIVKHKIKTLKRITDQNFATRTEWINWYQENKDNIVLSQDGMKLVVKDTN